MAARQDAKRDRATGELAGIDYEEIVYEGYGPGGVAILLKIMTDNHNRSAEEIRHIFTKNGGNLGETGSVVWMFDHKGLIVVDKEDLQVDNDEILWRALDLGAEDVRVEDRVIEIITTPEDYEQVKEGFGKHGLNYSYTELTMLPQTTIKLKGQEAKQMLKLMDALEKHDDVQVVWANHHID